METLFGTDGIRGLANQHPITAEVMHRVARAAAQHLNIKKVVIGKDTRRSCYMMETALSAGFLSMGTDVMLMGPMPTPAIAFLTSSMRADAGVVISASHNPFQDNGIKFFDRQGFKLRDEDEEAIEGLAATLDASQFNMPTGAGLGRLSRIREIKGRYIVFAKSCFPRDLTLEGVKIVVDCGNGATYEVAPMVLEELGADVITMNVKPNGININEGCGALYPELLCQRVRDEKAMMGVAFDGDGDRAVFCDEQGNLIHGDAILAIAALFFKSQGRLENNAMVATVMSNLGLTQCLEKHGVSLVRCAVGDRNVVHAMKEHGLVLGGEQSGHIVFLDHNTTGDGIITMLEMLAISLQSGKPMSELASVLTLFPQELISVKVREKRDFSAMPKVTDAIKQVESDLGDEGRINVRYSGTEQVARIMVEGASMEKIRAHAQSVAEAIKKEVGLG